MQKKIRASAGDWIDEVLRRVSVSGVGELKIPRDALALLQSNVDRVISKAVSKIDANKVLEDLVRNHKIRISAEVTLVPHKRRGEKKKRK